MMTLFFYVFGQNSSQTPHLGLPESRKVSTLLWLPDLWKWWCFSLSSDFFKGIWSNFPFQHCLLRSIPLLFTAQHPLRCPAVIVNVTAFERIVLPRDRAHVAGIRTHLKVKCLDVKTRTNLRDLTLRYRFIAIMNKKCSKQSEREFWVVSQKKTLHRKDFLFCTLLDKGKKGMKMICFLKIWWV